MYSNRVGDVIVVLHLSLFDQLFNNRLHVLVLEMKPLKLGYTCEGSGKYPVDLITFQFFMYLISGSDIVSGSFPYKPIVKILISHFTMLFL